MTELLIIIISVSIGVPVGMWLSRALTWAWYAAEDLVDDLRIRARNRKP